MKLKGNRVSNFFYNLKKNLLELWGNINRRLQQRILDNKEKVQANAKGILFFEILDQIEEILYRKKLTKWLMPFVEYIAIGYLILLVVIEVITTHNVYGFEAFSILPIFLFILCMIKRKYLITFFGVLIITIERILLLKKYHEFSNELGDKVNFTFIVFAFETIIFIFFLLKILGIWYHSKAGIKLRYEIANFLIRTTDLAKIGDEVIEKENALEMDELLKKELLKSQAIDTTEYITLDQEVIAQLKKNVDSFASAKEEINEKTEENNMIENSIVENIVKEKNRN